MASRIGNPKSMASLEIFVGGLKNKKIVYIPTAANGENGWGNWQRQGGSWELINKVGADIKPVLLEEYRNKSVLQELENSDIILFAGGVAGYLMYWLKRCEIDKNIKRIIGDEKFLVGSSAGAMIFGQSLEVGEFYFTDEEIGAGKIEPLKLVDFDIYPHFEEKNLKDIKKLYTGKKLYLLKDGEQIIIDGDKMEVQGEERVVNGRIS